MTPDQQVALAAKALDIARSYIGTKESTGHNDGTFVEMLQHWIEGAGQTWMKGQPWCAAFATWDIHDAAVDLGLTPTMPKSASSSQIWTWANAHGAVLHSPAGVICLALEKAPSGSGKSHDHTCFANGLGGNLLPGQDWFYSIDGNWSNSVCRPSPHHKLADYDYVKIV